MEDTTIIAKELQALNVSTPLSFEGEEGSNVYQSQSMETNKASASLLDSELWELARQLEEGGGECVIHVGFNGKAHSCLYCNVHGCCV